MAAGGDAHEHDTERGHDHGEHSHGEQGHPHDDVMDELEQDDVGRSGGTHGHTHLPRGEHAMSTEEGLRVVANATVAMFAVALIEFGFFALGNSAGLLSDALHNLGDVLTTVALFVAFRLARRPATRRHTYGFHRAEDLAGAVIAIVIVLSAVAAGYESFRHLVEHAVPRQIGWGILAALIGFAGNEALAEYKLRAGRRLGSQALVADGQHSRIDGITSLAAAVGLVLTWLGWRQADAIAGLVISVAILYILLDVGREVIARLMDAVEPGALEEARALALATPGVRRVDEVRGRWAGRQLFIALILAADAGLTLAEAHDIAERVRQEVLAHVPGAAIVDIHVDPADLPGGRDPHGPLASGHADLSELIGG